MSRYRWREEIIKLGQLGRKNSERVEAREHLDLNKGLYRLEGTEEMKKSRDFLVSRMKAAGLNIRVDRVGNIFGRQEGSRPNERAVMLGSHLDSVSNGGMFDGVVGVIGALEAARMMMAEGFINRRPIEVVAFMGEEGSAFKKGGLGSDVLVGNRSIDEVLALKNDEGSTLEDALEKSGYKGDFLMNLDSVEYFIELHIEQGPVLDREETPIGIVENITGISWLNAVFEGEENHAGTTPMSLRRDPLLAAASVVLSVRERVSRLAREAGSSTVATVGRLVVHPGAPNIIPGRVEIGIDIRDSVGENIRRLRDEVAEEISNLGKQHELGWSLEVPCDYLPCPCSSDVVNTIEKACAKRGIKSKRMNSGAGHDAMNLAEKVKTGMIFVPSVHGISHSPMEWTNWEDVENGIQVLFQTMKDLCAI
jgi:hydantoinase/carbamoylase family amidase